MKCPECGAELWKLASHGRMLWHHTFLTETDDKGIERTVGEVPSECPLFAKKLDDDGVVWETDPATWELRKAGEA